MHLGADSLNELAVGVHALDEGDHSLSLCIVGVQVVVVNVQPGAVVRIEISERLVGNSPGTGVGLLGSLERD